MAQGGANKVRVDINITAETKRLLDNIIQKELEEDRENDRPERSKSMILEMVFRKGGKAWNSRDHKNLMNEPGPN